MDDLLREFLTETNESLGVVDVVPARHVRDRHADFGGALDGQLVHPGGAPWDIGE